MSWNCYCTEAILHSLDDSEDYGRPGSQSECPHCGLDRSHATNLEDAKLRITQLPAALPIRYLLIRPDEEYGDGDFHQSCPRCRETLLIFDGFPELGSVSNAQCWKIPLRCRSCSYRFQFLIISCDGDRLVYRWFRRTD